MQVFMLCPFYRYIDKRAAYALPPEILTYGDIFYISVPVPIFSQFNFSDAFIVLVVKIYYLISIVNIPITSNGSLGLSISFRCPVFISVITFPASLLYQRHMCYPGSRFYQCIFYTCPWYILLYSYHTPDRHNEAFPPPHRIPP